MCLFVTENLGMRVFCLSSNFDFTWFSNFSSNPNEKVLTSVNFFANVMWKFLKDSHSFSVAIANQWSVGIVISLTLTSSKCGTAEQSSVYSFSSFSVSFDFGKISSSILALNFKFKCTDESFLGVTTRALILISEKWFQRKLFLTKFFTAFILDEVRSSVIGRTARKVATSCWKVHQR